MQPLSSVKSDKAPRPLSLRIHSAIRWLHTYISLVTLLVVLFFSVLYVLINLLVDLSYLWLDPRIRY